MMQVAVIKYNGGNIFSVCSALKRLGIDPLVTDCPEEISRADKVIFPGVGAAGSAMNSLRLQGLDRLIPELRQPVLGICLGMQLLCESSEENQTAGLGVFKVMVKRFSTSLKIPQMGWNRINGLKGELYRGVEEGSHCYFVHSFFAEQMLETTAVCNYGLDFSAALEKNNFFGVQFHPEKSGSTGALILKNFLEL